MAPERPAGPFLPLPAAAALAFERLAGERCEDGNLLDAVATALAACMALYAGEPPRRLSDEELAGGRFARGAAVLVRDGVIAFAALRIERGELEAAIDRLERAGVSFSHVRRESGPRRLPTVVPA